MPGIEAGRRRRSPRRDPPSVTWSGGFGRPAMGPAGGGRAAAPEPPVRADGSFAHSEDALPDTRPRPDPTPAAPVDAPPRPRPRAPKGRSRGGPLGPRGGRSSRCWGRPGRRGPGHARPLRGGAGLAHRSGHFPTATFIINTSGALLLGLLLTVLLGQPFGHRQWRAFFGTGVLGGWTTYSTLAVARPPWPSRARRPAAGYLGASLAAGLAAVGLGMALGRSLVNRTWRHRPGGPDPTPPPLSPEPSRHEPGPAGGHGRWPRGRRPLPGGPVGHGPPPVGLPAGDPGHQRQPGRCCWAS